MCAQGAFNLICSQPLTPHSCLLEVNSLCIYMFQSSRYGLERVALVLGHKNRLEELLRFTVVFKNLFLKLENVVPDLEREHALKKDG